MEPEDDAGNRDGRSQDRLDHWLDTALQEYGRAEPRMGLESRVLASVAEEKARAASRRRWAVGSAAAIAAVVIVVWLGVAQALAASLLATGRATPSRRDAKPLEGTHNPLSRNR